MPQSPPKKISWLLAGAAMLVVGSIALVPVLTGAKAVDKTNAFWFIGLLVIITAALTATAMVFRGLDLTNQNEAFALPSGSIRTLLAIGIMVLFAVFGLTIMGSATTSVTPVKVDEKPLPEIDVDSERLADEVKRYEQAKFVVVVVAPGRAASAGIAAVPAKIRLLRDNTKSQSAIDLEKQILTAIITLLTSVIGFYFGSRSATEGVRAAHPDPTAKPAMPDPASALSRLAALQQRLDRLRAHPKPTEQVSADAFGKALGEANKAIDNLDVLRRKIEDTTAGAAERTAALVELQAGSADLEAMLARAEQLIAEA